MRLLLDENLSPALIAALADLYPDSEHVRNVGLQSSEDRDIWQYAAEHNLVIVTRDDDFRELSIVRGHPPKVIWLTLGNCSTDLIERLLRDHHEELMAFHQHEDQSLAMVSV